ncbi:MAG TPA: hypothetical protein DDZ90_12220, partial [Planctomycetaceae bacterium]|nr:hypothetical protein [Planctomycetaceae bacterium]
MKKQLLSALFILLQVLPVGLSAREQVDGKVTRADVLVYGSTPGGVCAAIAASREGASV